MLRALWIAQGSRRGKSVGEVAEKVIEREYRRVQRRLALRGVDIGEYLERARSRAGQGTLSGKAKSGALSERREALNTLRNGGAPTVL